MLFLFWCQLSMSCHTTGNCFKASLSSNTSCPSFMSIVYLSLSNLKVMAEPHLFHSSLKEEFFAFEAAQLFLCCGYFFFFQAPLVMLFISACTFAVRWIAKPKPLVDNMLSVSRCYSSRNCINVARWSGKLFVFLSNMCVRVCVCACVWVWALFRPFLFYPREWLC